MYPRKSRKINPSRASRLYRKQAFTSKFPRTARDPVNEGFFAGAAKGTTLLLALSAGVLYLTGALVESEARQVLGLTGLLASGALKERYLANGYIFLNGPLLGGAAVLVAVTVLMSLLAETPWGRVIRSKIKEVRTLSFWPILASVPFVIGFIASNLVLGPLMTWEESNVLKKPPLGFPSPEVFTALALKSSLGALLVALATMIIYPLIPRRPARAAFLIVSLSMCAVNITLMARAAGFASVLRNRRAVVRIFGSAAVVDGTELLFLDGDDKNIAVLSRLPDRSVILIPRSDIKRLLTTGTVRLSQFLCSDKATAVGTR